MDDLCSIMIDFLTAHTVIVDTIAQWQKSNNKNNRPIHSMHGYLGVATKSNVISQLNAM